MDKNDIINYVMETPGNSNPAVLRGMLDSQDSNKKDIVIVTLTLDPSTGTYTCDKTFQELIELYSQGTFLVLGLTMGAMPAGWAYLGQFINDTFVFEHVGFTKKNNNITSIMITQYYINNNGVREETISSPVWAS